MGILYKQFMDIAIDQIEEMGIARKKKKEEILKEWEATKKLSRKKKKKRRKELQLYWDICNWNPFEMGDDEMTDMLKIMRKITL